MPLRCKCACPAPRFKSPLLAAGATLLLCRCRLLHSSWSTVLVCRGGLPCCCGLICSRNIIKDLPARPPLRPQTVGCTTSITGTFPSRLKVHIGSGSLAGQDLLDCVAVFPRPKSKIQKNGRQPDPGSSVGSWTGRRLKVLLLVFCCCRAGLPCSRAVLL